MDIKNLVSKKVASIPKSAIHEMTALSKKIEDVAFLSWAKPTSGTPENINQAASQAIQKGLTGGYSETAGLEDLREEIVKKLRRKNKISANPSEILVTVGAIEGLSAAVLAVVDPGDEVIIPVPGYSTHVRQIELASGRPVLVPTVEDQGFKLDLNQIEDAVTSKTKAIVFSSPNNPTGAAYTEEELRSIAEIAQKNNLIVITDEAYEYFTFDGMKHFSIGSIEEIKDQVISTFTFTKTYAMTGWRIGYVHASKEWIAQIKKAHIPLAICAPVVSQYAALEALRGPQDCIDEFHSHYLKTRNLMCSRLDELDHVFTYQIPKGSYLMFPKMIREQDQDSRTFAIDLLQKAHVSTTPGIAFKGEGHVRMSFCVSEEEINKAFDRMKEYFSS